MNRQIRASVPLPGVSVITIQAVEVTAIIPYLRLPDHGTTILLEIALELEEFTNSFVDRE
jgi:hypothetical protein